MKTNIEESSIETGIQQGKKRWKRPTVDEAIAVLEGGEGGEFNHIRDNYYAHRTKWHRYSNPIHFACYELTGSAFEDCAKDVAKNSVLKDSDKSRIYKRDIEQKGYILVDSFYDTKTKEFDYPYGTTISIVMGIPGKMKREFKIGEDDDIVCKEVLGEGIGRGEKKISVDQLLLQRCTINHEGNSIPMGDYGYIDLEGTTKISRDVIGGLTNTKISSPVRNICNELPRYERGTTIPFTPLMCNSGYEDHSFSFSEDGRKVKESFEFPLKKRGVIVNCTQSRKTGKKNEKFGLQNCSITSGTRVKLVRNLKRLEMAGNMEGRLLEGVASKGPGIPEQWGGMGMGFMAGVLYDDVIQDLKEVPLLKNLVLGLSIVMNSPMSIILGAIMMKHPESRRGNLLDLMIASTGGKSTFQASFHPKAQGVSSLKCKVYEGEGKEMECIAIPNKHAYPVIRSEVKDFE